jgi:hypothetical protein
MDSCEPTNPEIAALERLINTSAKSVVVDGTHMSFDLEAARHRLAELKRQMAHKPWPPVSTIRLDRGFPE